MTNVDFPQPKARTRMFRLQAREHIHAARGVVVALIAASGYVAVAFSPTPVAGLRCHPAGGRQGCAATRQGSQGEPTRASRWEKSEVKVREYGDSGEWEASGGDRAMPRRAVLVSAAAIAAAAATPREAAHCETQVCIYVKAKMCACMVSERMRECVRVGVGGGTLRGRTWSESAAMWRRLRQIAVLCESTKKQKQKNETLICVYVHVFHACIGIIYSSDTTQVSNDRTHSLHLHNINSYIQYFSSTILYKCIHTCIHTYVRTLCTYVSLSGFKE